MQWLCTSKQSTNKRKICLLQKPDLGKDVLTWLDCLTSLDSPGLTVSPECLTWSPPDRLSHLTPSLQFLSYLCFIYLDGNVLNLQVQTGFWTLQFQLSIWVDAHFSWSKDRLENCKTKQWENDPFMIDWYNRTQWGSNQTQDRTCGLNSQDQKTHCIGNEGRPCPYCWWNTLTPPAQGGGEGEGRKKRKEGRASLVRVQEKFPKH